MLFLSRLIALFFFTHFFCGVTYANEFTDALDESRFHQRLGEPLEARSHFVDVFTQGLIKSEGKVWESSGGYGTSFLLLWDYSTGEVINKGKVPDQYFAEGITLLNDQLYMLTLNKGLAYQLDPYTFQVIKEHLYQGPGWGLTTDGAQLIMSSGSDMLQFIDPETFKVIRQTRVRIVDQSVYGINELEWVDGKVWANVYQTDYILVIDPVTGLVEKRYYLPELKPVKQKPIKPNVLNGIAWDKEKNQVLITGKNWSRLYIFDLSKE